MSYYMGDFYGSPSMYRGPGRGDPGFFSFLGGLAKKAVGLIPGIGPAVSQAIEHIPAAGMRGAASAAMKRGAGAAAGAIIKHPVISAAGAAGAVAAAAGVGAEAMKHKRRIEHALGMGGKRRRRMNVCNPKALRRSIRRAHGFAKLAMRTIHLVHPKKKVRFGGFRKRKAR